MKRSVEHIEKQVMEEKLNLLFDQAGQILISSTVVVAILLMVLWGHVESQILVVLAAAVVLTNVMRMLLVITYRKKGLEYSSQYSWYYTVITGLSGLSWGIGLTVCLQSADLLYRLFIVIIAVGVVAGAQSSYSSSMSTYRAFMLPTLLIPGTWFFLQEEQVVFAIGLLLVAHLIVMFSLNMRNYKLVHEGLFLRHENENLVQELTEDVEKRKINEVSLQQKTEQLQSLVNLNESLTHADYNQEIIEAVAIEVECSIGYKNIWLHLSDADARFFRFSAANIDCESLYALPTQLAVINMDGNQLLAEAKAGNKAVFIENTSQDKRVSKYLAKILGQRSMLCVPIWVTKDRQGFICMASAAEQIKTLGMKQIDHVAALASRAAQAIERVRTIEDKLEVQLQLQHAQRVDSLGVMAGGIAHDFNNILTAIMGSASLAQLKLGENQEEIQEHIQRIVEASKRAALLSNQMLAYSGKGKVVVETTDLSKTVEGVMSMLDASIGRHVDVQFSLSTELPSVEVDIAQMQQVIMNLIINASEAVGKENGYITVSTGEVDVDLHMLDTYVGANLEPGHYVFLEVTDNGCGMDEEVAERVFEPFFTTKFTGRGLGLSAMQGIIKGHHGTITLTTEKGQGTTFRVLLPISLPVAAEESILKQQQDDAPAAQGTILVIDDEKSLVMLAQEILEDEGLTVLTATSGDAGVELYQQHQDDIVMVLLDMTMPQMNGVQCLRLLMEMNEDIKVVVVSGYVEDEMRKQFEGLPIAGFISKPYLPAELVLEMNKVVHHTVSNYAI